MHETRNNFFRSKKRNATLHQAKTGEHKCRNITTTYLLHLGTPAYLFPYDEESCYASSTRNIFCEFLTVDCVVFQSDIQSLFKTPVSGASLSYFNKNVSEYI